MKYLKYYLLALLMILIDQIVKLLVHFNMEFGTSGEIPIFGDWFKLHYTLNEGMAFGITWGQEYGKLALTLFRWIAIIAIGVYIYVLEKKQTFHKGYIWSVALILGGAVGNVIDSTFYGAWLEGNVIPYSENNTFLYPYFHGKVIDMFYLDIWQGYLPENLPLFGGNYLFLWPIFNVADASIFIGVSIILIFQSKFFPQSATTL
jgi:signal peptidase II